MAKKFGLSPLTYSVTQITAPLMKGERGLWAQLAMRWPEVVGSVWGEQTFPEKLLFPTEKNPRGVLHLAVWGKDALELAYEASYLCEKVNQYLGFAAVHQVKWRLRAIPVSSPTPKSPPFSPKPALSSLEQQWIEKHLEHVEDDLGVALHRLGETLLQNRSSR